MERGQIDHVDLTVSNVETSERFYRVFLGYLGFQPVRLVHGNSDLRIFQRAHRNKRLFSVALQGAKPARRGVKHDRYSPGLHHIAFRASSRADVDGLHEHLKTIGAHVLDPPAEYPHYAPGYYAVFFADPDGLKLEVVHMPRPPAVFAQKSRPTRRSSRPRPRSSSREYAAARRGRGA